MPERKPTGNILLVFALRNIGSAEHMNLAGWLERSETQHVRAGSIQPTRNRTFRSPNS